MLEINLENYEYSVIGLIYGNMSECQLAPNLNAKKISKAKFDKYYEIAIKKINLLK